MEAGANKDLQDTNGRTALILASKRGYTECVKLLEAATSTKPKDSKLKAIEKKLQELLVEVQSLLE